MIHNERKSALFRIFRLFMYDKMTKFPQQKSHFQMFMIFVILLKSKYFEVGQITHKFNIIACGIYT